MLGSRRCPRAGRGDDRLFQAIVGELEAEGFKVVGADQVMATLLAPEGLLTRAAPDDAARRVIDTPAPGATFVAGQTFDALAREGHGGRAAVGVDLNPLAVLVARAKTGTVPSRTDPRAPNPCPFRLRLRLRASKGGRTGE